MVVTNHPLATAAAHQILAEGGNAIDAAVGALFALCVVEPMMVGVAGGGLAHVRLSDGTHRVVDGLACAGAAMHAEMFDPVAPDPPDHMKTKGRKSELGALAVATPGNLASWELMHRQWGVLNWSDVIEPALLLAERGFRATPYLHGAISEAADDLAQDPELAALFLPDGAPLRSGSRLVQCDLAQSLRLIARTGASALYHGDLAVALIRYLETHSESDTHLRPEDLAGYQAQERLVIRGSYRGFDIIGPPPPASSGVHIVQMLNLLEAHDLRGMGFGTAASIHLLAEVIRIGFEDRRLASGDPDFVDIPVDMLISKEFAVESQTRLRKLAQPVRAASPIESKDTTHVTIADRDGNVVTATHTINGLFGARFMVPGTGIIPNNYMMNFDPNKGRALSIAPGKRVPTSMAPMMVLRDGAPKWALGLPGGVRIFPSALQTIVNLIDHEMSLQEAVEAPRLWTEGYGLELEPALHPVAPAMAAIGHLPKLVPHIGGGMNAIAFGPANEMTGAACWRADGTVAALGGGLARAGVRFWPGTAPEHSGL